MPSRKHNLVPNCKHGSARAFQQSNWNIFDMDKPKYFSINLLLEIAEIFDEAIRKKNISLGQTPSMGDFSQNS